MSVKKYTSLTVDEFTTPDLIKVYKDASLLEVWNTMETKGIRHVIVSGRDQEVCGIISDRDVRMFSQSNLIADLKAQDIMHSPVFTVRSGTLLSKVALEMSKNKYGSALVYDEKTGEYGIFTATDALNALVEVLRGDV